MAEPGPDNRQPADFDRVFAEMTANWPTEEPEPPPPAEQPPARQEPTSGSDAWAADHPLFRHTPEPEPGPDHDEDFIDRFDRPEVEPIPWRQLSPVTVVGALLIGFTVAVLLLVVLGLRFPTPVGYAAVGSFVLGFGLLMTRLRHDQEPGGGARL